MERNHIVKSYSNGNLVILFQVSSLRNSSSVPSQPIQQLYDEMYMDPSSPAVTLNNSRRYSYPNSPVHASQLTSSTSTASTTLSQYHPTQDLREQHPSQQLDQRLQQLKLQHIAAIDEEPSKVQQVQLGENEAAVTSATCCSTPRSPLAWKGSITQGVPAASPTPIMSSLAVLNAPNAAMAHSASFDEAYESQSNTVKVQGRGVISGSATNLWHLSSMEDSDVDYVSLPFTPSTTPRPSMAPCPQSAENNPEICVTNVTGDEIKFVFGSAGSK